MPPVPISSRDIEELPVLVEEEEEEDDDEDVVVRVTGSVCSVGCP